MKTKPLTMLVLDVSRARKKDTELLDHLKSRGLVVKSMRDPRRGATVLKKGQAQLVLLIASGRPSHPPEEVLERFREANSDVPVIVVSPRPKLDEAVSLVRGHAYDYLDRKDLWDDLDRCLDRAIAEKGYTLSREEQLDVTLGERLRAARKANDLTLQQLAARAGVSVSLISQIELARSSGSVRTLFKLSRALGVPLEELFADY